MSNNYLCDYVKCLLEKNNIKVKDAKTCNYLTTCIENIIFNVVSIASVITFINNCKTVKKESISIVTKYLNSMCGSSSYKTVKGGGGSIILPSEFYGIDSTRYSPMNNLHTTNTLDIDFTNGIARPQIGGGLKKSSSSSSNSIMKGVNDILDYYKLKATKEIKMKMVKLIECYIKCLMNKLKELNTTITCSSVDKVMKSDKVFELFK
jgi:hypothetical protein